MMRRILPAILFALFAAAPTLAQQPTAPSRMSEELVDRVVAVVGDTVLLLSDVYAELQQLEAAGQQIPTDPRGQAALIANVVQSRVDQLVLLEAARAAGGQVREEEVTDLVEQDVRTLVQQRFGGSEAAFRSALAASGMSLEQYRYMLASQYRDRMLAERFMQQRLALQPRPAVSEAEIREMFEAQREAIGPRPASVSFRQILIDVRPSEEAREEARQRAEQVLEELRQGGNFEVLARRFSDDPGTREHGGNLGWFRRGRMVPAFENAVYALRPGQTSGLVETDFGFHIIRLDRARGAERQARHILIRPEVTETDFERARVRADSIANEARTGTPFAELMRRHPSPMEQGTVERVPLDRLPAAYAEPLTEAERDAVVGPFEVPGPVSPRFAVVKLTDRYAAGAYTLDDLRDQIRTRLQEQKMIEQLVDELRHGVHVQVML